VSRNAGCGPQLMVSKVAKQFGRVVILDCADLSVHGGEIVALTRRECAGKTTPMRICAGLLRADAGSVTVGGPIGYCRAIPGAVRAPDGRPPPRHVWSGFRQIDRAESLRRGHGILASSVTRSTSVTSSGDLSARGRCQKLQPRRTRPARRSGGASAGRAVSGDSVAVRTPDFRTTVSGGVIRARRVVVVTHLLAELERVDRVVRTAHAPLLAVRERARRTCEITAPHR
jgi:energy-coupling factor transporter ATP-binding protein EcfA2